MPIHFVNGCTLFGIAMNNTLPWMPTHPSSGHKNRKYRSWNIFRYGTPDNPGVRVAEQHPVFSLIPANFHYQPIVEVADVYVPDDYEANTLKSESPVLALPYAISHTGRYAVHFDV